LTFAEAAQPWLDTHCAGEQTPVFIGGDHSIGLVTFSFLHKKLFQEKGSAELGLLWVDAHADINTASTSPSGNLHGMVVANLLGMGVPELAQLYHPAIKLDPKNVAYVGLRDIDPGEEEYLSKLEIQRTSASEVRSLGLAEVLRKALAVVEKCRDGFVLSFDMDVCDPSIAPGVSTPVPGGLSREEMCTLLTQVGKSSKLRAAEFVELNPSKDHERKTAELLVQGLKALAGISR
jgi:arginase